MTAAIRKHLAENPSHFDPRQYLTPAREAMKQMYIHKIVDVLGSNDKL
jgi:fructose-bisphosphate aldolase class II